MTCIMQVNAHTSNTSLCCYYLCCGVVLYIDDVDDIVVYVDMYVCRVVVARGVGVVIIIYSYGGDAPDVGDVVVVVSMFVMYYVDVMVARIVVAFIVMIYMAVVVVIVVVVVRCVYYCVRCCCLCLVVI